MKWATVSAILVFVASGAWAWGASQSLKSTMKTWKAAAQITAPMANGAAPFDEARVRATMETFIADSQAIGARLTATTLASQDVKLRFARFGADAADALALLGSRDKFNASYARVLAECKSCHDQYAR